MEETVRLKLQLEGIKPEIWRRIVVPSSYTLTELLRKIEKTDFMADDFLITL